MRIEYERRILSLPYWAWALLQFCVTILCERINLKDTIRQSKVGGAAFVQVCKMIRSELCVIQSVDKIKMHVKS